MFRPEIRSGVGLSLKCHTSPLPSPWGTRGKESLRLSIPQGAEQIKSTRDGRAAKPRGTKAEAQRNNFYSLLPNPSSLLPAICIVMQMIARGLPQPFPPSPLSSTSKMLFVFAKREVFKETKGAQKFQIWLQSSGFKRRFHRRHLSSSNSVRLSYVRSLPAPPGEKFFLHCKRVSTQAVLPSNA